MPQKQEVYWYYRADATTGQDISGDPFRFSIDGGVTWTDPAAAVYIPTGSLPPKVAAVDAADPLDEGMTGFWWRILSGPGQPLPLALGLNDVIGWATDSPETPRFHWETYVDSWQ